jgi:branched-chain amino acid transport system permease protein
VRRRLATTATVAGAIAVVIIAAVLACKAFLPSGLPNGIILLGLITGGLNALPALGIVLIYRANRIVNFAQGELGAFAATLAFMLMVTLHWPWGVAVPLALVAGIACGAFVEFAIMRRFFAAPRLLVTVATIGVAQLLGGFRLGMPGLFPDVPGFTGTFPSPFNGRAFDLGIAVYSWNHVIVLLAVPAATILVMLFLRGTWAGLGTRAAAGNLERSRLLGVPVRRLSTIVWALAGLLSALSAILRAPVEGFSLASYSGTALLTRSLTAAAIGGFENLPLTFAASLVLGVVEQGFFWNYGQGGPIQALLLAILLVALLIRSRRARVTQGDERSSWVAVREMARLPRRVLRLPQVRTATIASALVACATLLLLPAVLPSAKLTLLGLIGIQVMVALSLVILSGWGGQVSLGQWALVGVGAFVAGNLAARWGVDFFATLAIAGLAGGLVSLLLGIPAQRLSGPMFGVTTLVFAAAAADWLFQLNWVAVPGNGLGRPLLFGRIDLSSDTAFYYVILAAMLLSLAAVWNMKRFRLADVLLATRDNPEAAAAFGISVTAARRTAFFVAGVLAGVAGVLYAFQQQIVDADRFPAELGPSMLAMVVIGGLGSISGAVLGAVYVRTTQYLLPAWMGFFASGLGLLAILLVLPGGLGELVFRIRSRVVAWLARSRGISLDRRDLAAHAPPPQVTATGPPEPIPR